MKEHMYMHKFSYDKYLNAYEMDKFLVDFVNDPNVQSQMRVLSPQDTWGKMGKVARLDYEEIQTTVTSMHFFDRLKEQGTLKVMDDQNV